MFVEISSVGQLYQQLKGSHEARLALIRRFICFRREAPLQSFHSWLQEQRGMQNATEKELDELYELTFSHTKDEVLGPPTKL